MCLAADDTGSPKCGMGTTGRWISTALLSSSSHYRKIFTQAAVARDNLGNMWVYVGTGDKMHPVAVLKDSSNNTVNDRLYAIMDNDLSTTHTLNNLQRYNIRAVLIILLLPPVILLLAAVGILIYR